MAHSIEVGLDGHVATILFASPPYNHASTALLHDIADVLDKLDDMASCRAIVLASSGKQFCAGADLLNDESMGGEEGGDGIRAFYDAAIRIFAARKPIVAAIQGAAVGAGLGLAAAADMRVASPEARFCANFTRLAFHPGFALTLTLPRLIGMQHATEMFLTSGRYKAEQALSWGLIDRLTESGGAMGGAQALAREIAVNGPLSLLATRATLREHLVADVKLTLMHEHAEQMKLRDTADHAEGVAATAERRDPDFTGR